ncbi:MAG: hypothetical protein CMO01_32275 [Thalassobius sp.]|nr:hypothetical protein [Thalassovita sp.]
MDTQNTESHHLLPSGEWEGFYCYSNSPEQHKMAIELSFSNKVVSGSGEDDVAPFTWDGNYNLDTFIIKMIKTYATHKISYKGDIDENGIWGIWEDLTDLSGMLDPETIKYILEKFSDKIKGGFHIWPKKQKSESNQEELKESKKLAEIFIEHF